MFGLKWFQQEKPVLVRTAQHCFRIKRSHVAGIYIDDSLVKIDTTWASPCNYCVYPGTGETLESLHAYLVELLMAEPTANTPD